MMQERIGPDHAARRLGGKDRALSSLAVTGTAAPTQPCFMCGCAIRDDEFSAWSHAPGTRYAICGRCGAPNSDDDAAFVVLDQDQTDRLPPPMTGVFPLASGGWRATCDCGLTEATITQAAGWDWALDHECMPRL